MAKEHTVTISKQEFIEMTKATNMWYHLQALGVDNWEGYEVPEFDADGNIVEEEEDE